MLVEINKHLTKIREEFTYGDMTELSRRLPRMNRCTISTYMNGGGATEKTAIKILAAAKKVLAAKKELLEKL